MPFPVEHHIIHFTTQQLDAILHLCHEVFLETGQRDGKGEKRRRIPKDLLVQALLFNQVGSNDATTSSIFNRCAGKDIRRPRLGRGAVHVSTKCFGQPLEIAWTSWMNTFHSKSNSSRVAPRLSEVHGLQHSHTGITVQRDCAKRRFQRNNLIAIQPTSDGLQPPSHGLQT